MHIHIYIYIDEIGFDLSLTENPCSINSPMALLYFQIFCMYYTMNFLYEN